MIDRRSEEHLTAGFVFVAGFDHGHDESLSESSSNTENLNDFTDNSSSCSICRLTITGFRTSQKDDGIVFDTVQLSLSLSIPIWWSANH